MTDNTDTAAIDSLAEIIYEASQYPDAYSTGAKAILAAIRANPTTFGIKPNPPITAR